MIIEEVIGYACVLVLTGFAVTGLLGGLIGMLLTKLLARLFGGLHLFTFFSLLYIWGAILYAWLQIFNEALPITLAIIAFSMLSFQAYKNTHLLTDSAKNMMGSEQLCIVITQTFILFSDVPINWV